MCLKLNELLKVMPFLLQKGLCYKGNLIPLRFANGAVAEWLGRGLQNLVQRFESAQRLNLLKATSKGLLFAFKVCWSG